EQQRGLPRDEGTGHRSAAGRGVVERPAAARIVGRRGRNDLGAGRSDPYPVPPVGVVGQRVAGVRRGHRENVVKGRRIVALVRAVVSGGGGEDAALVPGILHRVVQGG